MSTLAIINNGDTGISVRTDINDNFAALNADKLENGDNVSELTNDAGYLTGANNLSDVVNAATARTNLALGNVDNTSDAAKPVSTATQTALNLKANLASPTFTGNPKTVAPVDDLSIATKKYVDDNTSTSGPTAKFSTSFEATGRHTEASAGGGGVTYGTGGVKLDAFDTAGHASVTTAVFNSGANADLVNQSPTYSSFITLTGSTAGEAYMGVGEVTNAAAGHTFTINHFGFKLIEDAGTTTLYATQADGTTENVSSALTTVINTDTLRLIAVKNTTASIDYYWAKSGGVLSSATNLTSNMPTDSTNITKIQHSCNTSAEASNQMEMYVGGFTYEI